MRFCVAALLFVSSAVAQAPMDLMHRVEQHYASADSFEVKGTATTRLAGSSWKVGYSFRAQGIQPQMLPASMHATSMKDLGSVGPPMIQERVDPHATDPLPARGVGVMEPFGDYQRLTRRLLEAKEVGTETVTEEGRAHRCTMVDATFDTSPDYLPHTAVEHRRFWIDSTELVVLREQRAFDGHDWTADFTSVSFGKPVSAETVAALQGFEDQPKEVPGWVGRALPDLRLHTLSGREMKLSELRGKPVLLDFWGSYCLPCKTATLHAQELGKKYRDAGLTVVTFTMDDAKTAKLWVDHNHVDLPVVLDEDEAAYKAFDAFQVPVTILADEQGKVVHYWTSYEDASGIDAAVGSALRKRMSASVAATHQ